MGTDIPPCKPAHRALCAEKFSDLICRPIGAQFMEDNLIALFEFEESQDSIAIASEKHYRLVPPDQLTAEDLQAYRERSLNFSRFVGA
jgi:hypothetical protein